MRFVRRWSLPAALPACLLFLASAGAARAADDKTPPPETKSTDKLVRQALYEVANEGADMYNAEGRYANQERDLAGCYRLYEGALLAVRPLLASHDDLQKAIDDGLENARKTPEVYKRALVLREVIDKIRADLKPGGSTTPPPVVKTLWDRLGGEAGVAKVVDDFVFAVANDSKLDFSRGGRYLKDGDAVKHFKKMLVEQISTATGGPFRYTGRPMKDVHKGMEITNEEFDAAAAYFRESLKKNGVAPEDAKAVLDVVETTRKDIVEGKKEPPPPPKEKTVTGKVAKVEKDLIRVREEGGKEDRVFFIPAEAKVTLDGKEDKLENIKVDSAVTVTSRGDAVTKVEAKAPVPPPPPPPDTLWDRLGGETAVAKVVDDFVATASEDKEVNFYRDATFRPTKEQVADLKTNLVDFISSVTGGKRKYEGKGMKAAHKGMGITDKEFDAAAKDFKAALEKNGVKDVTVKELMALVETTRKDIVEKKADDKDKDKPKPDDKDKPKPDDKDKPGPDDSATISGKVTYKGQPLASGRITFVNTDGKGFTAEVKEDGTYKIDGLAPRDYTVAFETKVPDPKDPPKPKVVVIPAKYGDPKTSGLIISATKGKQTKDFDLSD